MRLSFKSIVIPAFTVIAVFAAIVYSSCNRDKCKSVVCAYGGVCNGGACICPSGYEGSNCETVSRDKFLGNWYVYEKGSITESGHYAISIVPGDNDITQVYIRNFYNYFRTPIKAYVVHDTLTIPNQQYEGKVVFGVGNIYTNTTFGQYGALTMRYEVIDTAAPNKVNDFGYYTLDGSDPSEWNK